MSLPTREQFEEWSPAQVASYLSQNKMRECATTVQKMKIDGRRFLSLSDTDLNKFSLIHRPQLQKMVQDIKKNDDSIFNRLKRFQTEQTANILKTGRNTLDRIKNKGPPKVPARDYPGDSHDAEWSGSEFDSDVYEDPQGEHDDNYEPPPCERVFTSAPSNSYPEDKCPGRPTQTKRIKPFLPAKPPFSEKQNQAAKDDEDYIDPEDGTDEDNYIDPSEKDTRGNKGKHLGIPRRSHSPDVYEVPDTEDSPVTSRCSAKHQTPALRLPPKPSPRANIKKPAPCPEPEDDDDYEVCNADDSPTSSPNLQGLAERPKLKAAEDRRPSIPVPLPREVKLQKPPVFPKAGISTRDHEASSASMARDPPNPGATPTPGFYRAKMSLPREIPHQKPPAAERGSLSREDSGTRQQEEEASVYKRPWYASDCDRKKAEDALIRSAKDGSYLVRKSSGVDALQPYTLVVFYNGRVYNIPVRYIPTTKQYALGKHKNGEERFSTVSDIIENHQKNALVLVDTQSNTKDSTKLRHAVKL
ncbi:B-cell linker protein isoform X2 [Pygocentrus nattereri]|uniref:B-cell linker protein isoform X2 n=1 Tax=Pygocentrus nattereri TaxID=42514 RepID=UPI00189160E5|nr:B-cell linker protein isoform X2 [Pygocentrus nattereri]